MFLFLLQLFFIQSFQQTIKLLPGKNNHNQQSKLKDAKSHFLQEQITPLQLSTIGDDIQAFTFYAQIGIGQKHTGEFQNINVLFDTGSCVFWIPDWRCTTKFCNQHNKYQKQDSFKDIGDFTDVQYRMGKVLATTGKETIKLSDDLIIQDQTLAFAYNVGLDFDTYVDYDGIIGLAYPNMKQEKVGAVPLFEHLIRNNILKQKGLQNIFSIYMGDSEGAIIFGKTEPTFMLNPEQPWIWAQLALPNYWTLEINDIYKVRYVVNIQRVVQNIQEICPKGCKSVIDTGTYFIYGPKLLVKQLMQQTEDIDPCDKKKMPDIVFEIVENNIFLTTDDSYNHENVNKYCYKSNHVLKKLYLADLYQKQFSQQIIINISKQPTFIKIIHKYIDLIGINDPSGQKQIVELRMTPTDYIVDLGGKCIIGIREDKEDHGWTFGQLLIKTFYTTFDMENQRIGFVRGNSYTNQRQME